MSVRKDLFKLRPLTPDEQKLYDQMLVEIKEYDERVALYKIEDEFDATSSLIAWYERCISYVKLRLTFFGRLKLRLQHRLIFYVGASPSSIEPLSLFQTIKLYIKNRSVFKRNKKSMTQDDYLLRAQDLRHQREKERQGKE